MRRFFQIRLVVARLQDALVMDGVPAEPAIVLFVFRVRAQLAAQQPR